MCVEALQLCPKSALCCQRSYSCHFTLSSWRGTTHKPWALVSETSTASQCSTSIFPFLHLAPACPAMSGPEVRVQLGPLLKPLIPVPSYGHLQFMIYMPSLSFHNFLRTGSTLPSFLYPQRAIVWKFCVVVSALFVGWMN